MPAAADQLTAICCFVVARLGRQLASARLRSSRPVVVFVVRTRRRPSGRHVAQAPPGLAVLCLPLPGPVWARPASQVVKRQARPSLCRRWLSRRFAASLLFAAALIAANQLFAIYYFAANSIYYNFFFYFFFFLFILLLFIYFGPSSAGQPGARSGQAARRRPSGCQSGPGLLLQANNRTSGSGLRCAAAGCRLLLPPGAAAVQPPAGAVRQLLPAAGNFASIWFCRRFICCSAIYFIYCPGAGSSRRRRRSSQAVDQLCYRCCQQPSLPARRRPGQPPPARLQLLSQLLPPGLPLFAAIQPPPPGARLLLPAPGSRQPALLLRAVPGSWHARRSQAGCRRHSSQVAAIAIFVQVADPADIAAFCCFAAFADRFCHFAVRPSGAVVVRPPGQRRQAPAVRVRLCQRSPPSRHQSSLRCAAAAVAAGWRICYLLAIYLLLLISIFYL